MKKGYVIGLISLLFLTSFLIDNWTALSLNILKIDFIHNLLVFVGFLSTWHFILIAASLLILLKKREILLPFWVSFFITGLISVLLKYIIKRPRPFEVLNLGVTHTFPSWNSSFPSWHAGSIFVVIPFLYLCYPKFKWIWIFLGFLVTFSRIYIGVHYLSDIFGGILLGLGISYLVIFFKNKVIK